MQAQLADAEQALQFKTYKDIPMTKKNCINVGKWLDSNRAKLIEHLESEGLIEKFVANSYEVHKSFKFSIGITSRDDHGEPSVEYYPCTVLATNSNFAKITNGRIGHDWKEYSKLNNLVNSN